jgi:hypothetical protein
MTLITGEPIGQQTDQEDLYLEGAPNIWFQDDRADLLNNPDSDGYYWGFSGTATYPAFELGCVEGVALADNLTMNDVVCDTVGVKDTIQRRNFLELTLTIKTIFPLSVLQHIIHGTAAVGLTDVEKMGLGSINNTLRYRVYMAKVYDDAVGDYLNITLHKAKFVDAWTLNFRYGDSWNLTGLKIRAFARDTLPSAQQFATIVRADPSAV